MKRSIYLILFALAVCFSANAAVSQRFDANSMSSSKHRAIQKHVKKYKSYKFDRTAFLKNLKEDSRIKLNLAGDYAFDMTLAENNLCAGDCVVECTGKNGTSRMKMQSRIYKGKTSKGDDVRLSVFSDKVSMVIIDGNGKQTYVKQAKELTNADDEELIVYTGEDVQVQEDRLYGNSNDVEKVQLPKRSAASNGSVSCAKLLELAIEVDYEMYKRLGYSTQRVYDEVMAALNLAESAYETYLSLTFSVKYIHIWTSSSVSGYPYSSSYNLETLLGKLKGYWNSNMTSVSRDICHMFTGNIVASNEVGRGYSFTGRSVAGTQNAYSITLYRDEMYKTTAHELGHNMGADHPVDEAGCGCGTTSTSVMCQGEKSDNLWFCSKSIQEIQAGIDYAGSILSLPSTFSITGMVSNSRTDYDASSLITANCNITNNSYISFTSFGRITLRSGFHVSSNSKFKAKVKSCGSLRMGTIIDDFDDAISDETLDGEASPAITLYPNPTDGEFTVAFAAEEVAYVLTVTDVAGKVVYSADGIGREQVVNLEGKASGVYFVRVNAGENTYFEKVILK